MDFYPYMAPKDVLESTWRLGFRVAAICGWLADLVREAGVDPRDVTSISCGVSVVHAMHVAPEAREASVAMMYGLGNYKAAHDGLKALELARSEVGPFRVRLFGANSSRRPSGIPEWAEYHALLTDSAIGDIYNSSSIFVSSSVAEGFCLPAAEAMASGCAVAATDSGGIRDFAIDGENALLSRPSDPDALARNIIRLLQDHGLRHRIAYAGRNSISKFTWPAAVGRLEAFVLDAR
jgi:glycosyltransferase involved in cell wall biosynthesis